MKKIYKLLLISILLLTPIITLAQEENTTNNTVNTDINTTSTKTVETRNRSEFSNLGVNKKWKITNENRSNVLRTPYVNADEKIYDFSNVINDDDEKELLQRITDFTKRHNTELIIVTYDLEYTNDKTNEDFAADFYDYNDFGLEIKDYDGIVLFRNTYEIDPYYDMYTFGKAQLHFNQDRYDDILDSIYDNLHSGNYYAGLSEFISKTDYYMSVNIPSNMKNKYIDEMGFIKANYAAPLGLAFIISVIVTIIISSILVNKNKMIRKETEALHYMNKASLNYTKKQDNFLTTHTSSYTVSSSSGGGGGGGFSSGGSSGGGHSSGGGRHG